MSWTEKELDFGKVSTEGPAPLEDGLYGFIVADAEVREKPTKDGDPMINVQLQVTHRRGEAPGTIKRKVYGSVVVTDEQAGFRLKQLTTALGIDPPKSTRLDVLEDFCDALVSSEGAWVLLGVSKPDKKGKVYNQPENFFNEEQAVKHEEFGVAGGAATVDDEPVVRRRRKAA